MAVIAPRPPPFREYVTEKYVLAVDLGQSNDPTAMAVIHHTHRHRYRLDKHEQKVTDTFDVRHLSRLPLGLSYVEQAAEVGRLLARPPLSRGCELVIDETGVGRPVGDIFDANGMEPIRVTITAGETQSWTGVRRWHVAKSLLISGLDARLHLGELRFAADLAEAGTMQSELKDFRRKVTAAGRYQYEARVGKHDDLVLAVAIGLWTVTGKPKPPVAQFSTWYLKR